MWRPVRTLEVDWTGEFEFILFWAEWEGGMKDRWKGVMGMMALKFSEPR